MSDSRSDDERHDDKSDAGADRPTPSTSEGNADTAPTGAHTSADHEAEDPKPENPKPGDSEPEQNGPDKHGPDKHGEGASEPVPTDEQAASTAHTMERDSDTNAGAGEGAGPPPPRRSRRSGGGRVPALLALLLALLAAGAAGYLGWRLLRLEQQVAAIPAEREDALASVARKNDLDALREDFEQRLQQALQKEAKALNAERKQALADVQQRLATLEQGVAGIRELAARDQVSWRLAEIRYLLAVAQRRVAIARDTRSAIAALEAADRSIAELGSVRLLPLRKRIVDDLTALRSIEPADVEGVALRLQNLLGRVASLPASAEGADDASGDGDSRPWWQRMTDRLERYVEVRHREAGPARGRPVPATDLPAADRLVLALERARSAALGREPEAYRSALAQARAVLAEGFAGGARATQRFAAGLDELRRRPVATELPDLGATVDLATRLSARIESSRELEPANDDHGES